VDFSYIVQDGDSIQVCPTSNGYIGLLTDREKIVSKTELCFVLDNHLGKLAIYLRILGFDTLYRNDFQDDELAEIASNDERILITRDRGLLMRKIVKYGYLIRNKIPKEQLVEVARRFGLNGMIKPLQRCLRCNNLLVRVNKRDVMSRLEPLTRLYYDEFHYCAECDQIYWKGSHYERMIQLLDNITNITDEVDWKE
jgi:uncharacterized protein with PIN domain